MHVFDIENLFGKTQVVNRCPIQRNRYLDNIIKVVRLKFSRDLAEYILDFTYSGCCLCERRFMFWELKNGLCFYCSYIKHRFGKLKPLHEELPEIMY